MCVLDDANVGPPQPGGNGVAVAGNGVQSVQLASQMNQLSVRVEALQLSTESGLNSMRVSMAEGMAIVNQNVNRLSVLPTMRRRAAPAPGAPVAPAAPGDPAVPGDPPLPPPPVGHAMLSKHPSHLADVWAEFQVGLGGRKPAKDFTQADRGRNADAYCRRKNIWDLIQGLILQGHSHTAAINKIYQAYGHGCSVSKIIAFIKRDKKTGGHPNLRIAAPNPTRRQGRMPTRGPDAIAGGRRAATAPNRGSRAARSTVPARGDGRGGGVQRPWANHMQLQNVEFGAGRTMDNLQIGALARAHIGGANIDFGPPQLPQGPPGPPPQLPQGAPQRRGVPLAFAAAGFGRQPAPAPGLHDPLRTGLI